MKQLSKLSIAKLSERHNRFPVGVFITSIFFLEKSTLHVRVIQGFALNVLTFSEPAARRTRTRRDCRRMALVGASNPCLYLLQPDMDVSAKPRPIHPELPRVQP